MLRRKTIIASHDSPQWPFCLFSFRVIGSSRKHYRQSIDLEVQEVFISNMMVVVVTRYFILNGHIGRSFRHRAIQCRGASAGLLGRERYLTVLGSGEVIWLLTQGGHRNWHQHRSYSGTSSVFSRRLLVDSSARQGRSGTGADS